MIMILIGFVKLNKYRLTSLLLRNKQTVYKNYKPWN